MLFRHLLFATMGGPFQVQHFPSSCIKDFSLEKVVMMIDDSNDDASAMLVCFFVVIQWISMMFLLFFLLVP